MVLPWSLRKNFQPAVYGVDLESKPRHPTPCPWLPLQLSGGGRKMRWERERPLEKCCGNLQIRGNPRLRTLPSRPLRGRSCLLGIVAGSPIYHINDVDLGCWLSVLFLFSHFASVTQSSTTLPASVS